MALARKSRAKVKKAYNSAEDDRMKFRQEKMVQEKKRKDALQKRAADEKARLSKIHLIKSVAELKASLSEIDEQSISTSKKAQKKRIILKEQINARKKVCKESVNIPFTTKGKQRPLVDIIKQFSAYLQCEESRLSSGTHDTDSYTPESLVGRRVLHRFEVEKEEKWFPGLIISYSPRSCLHEISYEGEEEHCYFNLIEDLLKGDLVVQAN